MTVHEATMASPPMILPSQRPQSPPIRGADKLKNSILANSQSGWTSTTVISPLKITKQSKGPLSPDVTPSPPLPSTQASPTQPPVRRTSGSFSHVRNNSLVSNSPFIKSPTLDSEGGPLGAKYRPIPQSESGGYKVLPRPSKIPGVTPRKPSPSLTIIAHRRVSPAQATRRASLEKRKRIMNNESFQKALAMEAAAMGQTVPGLGIISPSQALGKKASKGLSKVAEYEFVSKSPFVTSTRPSSSTTTSPSLTSSTTSSPQQSQPEESEDAEEPATPTMLEHQTPDIHVENASDGRVTPQDDESTYSLSEPSKSSPGDTLGVSSHSSRPLPASPRSRRAAAAFVSDSFNHSPRSPKSPTRRMHPEYASTPTPVRFIVSTTPTPVKSSLKSKRRIRGPRSPDLDGSFVVERTPSGKRRYGSLRRRHERRKTVTFDERCDVLEFEPETEEEYVDSEWVTSEEDDNGAHYAEDGEEDEDHHGYNYEHEEQRFDEDEPAPRSSEVDAIHGLVNSMIEDEMNEYNMDSIEAEYDQSGDSRHLRTNEEANTSLDYHEDFNPSVDFAATNTSLDFHEGSLDFQEANTSLDFHEDEGDSFELGLQQASQQLFASAGLDDVEEEDEEEEDEGTPQRDQPQTGGDLTMESAHLDYLTSPPVTPKRHDEQREVTPTGRLDTPSPVAESSSQPFLLSGQGQAFGSGSTLTSSGSRSTHLGQADSQGSLSGRASPRISREDVQRRLAEHRVGKAMLGDEEGQTESEDDDVPRRHKASAFSAFARRSNQTTDDGRALPHVPSPGSAERAVAPNMNRAPHSHDAVLQTVERRNSPDRPQPPPIERSLTTDGNLPEAAYARAPAHPSLTRAYDLTQPGVDIADVKSALDRLMLGVENGFLDDGSHGGSVHSRPGSVAGPSIPVQHAPVETVRSSWVLRASTPSSMPPEDVDSSQEIIASLPPPPPIEDEPLLSSRPTSLIRVKSGREILKEHEANVIAKRREARRRENSTHGRPNKRRSLSTGDAEAPRRERRSFVGQAAELLDVPIDEVDLPLTDSIDRELRNLNEEQHPKYRLREREQTIYAKADDRVSHMTRAGDLDNGKAWRVVRRASDMNEYAKQIRDWRNSDRSGRAHGKVFVKVLGVRDINVPIPTQPTDFTVTLNNGIHCVETPECRLDVECRIDQEFELIEHGQLEFTLTLKVRKDPHVEAQIQAMNAPRIAPSPVPVPLPPPPSKGGFLSLFGGSKKSKTHKRAYTQPEAILQPITTSPVNECLAKYLQGDGTLGTAFISFKDIAKRCDTRLFETSYPIIGYSVDDKRGSMGLQLGELVLQVFRLPPLPGVKPDHLPQSLEECHRGLRHIAWHKVMYHEGVLTQTGGDCKGWRRRHIKVIGANLVAFNDVTNRPTATIELKRAIAVIDNQDPNADPKSPISVRDDDDEILNVERSFRLVFPDNEVIAFFADSESDKSKWLEILRALIGRIPPNPLWAELVWQRQEELLSGQQQQRPSALPSVSEGKSS